MTEARHRTHHSPDEMLRMTTDVVVSYFRNNPLPVGDVPGVIKSVYASLNSLVGMDAAGIRGSLKPAVPIKKSVTPNYVICLEDGKKLKMLKRHLRTSFGLTPDQYRAKWGLPSDYPLVAPNYAAKRSALALKIGLGRKPGRKRKA